jgi:uncharacterized membrane protein YoaK (UPF0700 family)
MADRSQDDSRRPTPGLFHSFVDARRKNKSKTQVWLLDEDCHNMFAFIGGFVDSGGYVKLAELFTSSITGNLVAATASIYTVYGVVARAFVAIFFALGSFFTGVMIMKLKIHREWSPKAILRLCLALEASILFLGLAFGYIFRNSFDDDAALNNPELIVCASTLSFAMGLQSAAVKEIFPDCPSTTVITMLIVTFSTQAAGASTYAVASAGCTDLQPVSKQRPATYESDIRDKRDSSVTKFLSTSRQLFSFLIGGVVGASLVFSIDFAAFFVPILVLVVMLLDITVATPHPTPSKPSDSSNTTNSV